MDVSVVVPMFNEEDNALSTLSGIEGVLKSCCSSYEIVVVDDGSTDNTLKLVENAASRNRFIKVARHARNKGLGEAIKTGFANSSLDTIVTIDADLSYDPKQIPDFIKMLGKGFDIVVASPYMKGGSVEGIPFFRLQLSKLGNRLLAFSMGSGLHTVTSVFRAYRRDALKSISLKSSGPEINPELIAKARKSGFKIAEIPSTLKPRVKGKSKFRLWSGIKRHFILFLHCLTGNFDFYKK